MEDYSDESFIEEEPIETQKSPTKETLKLIKISQEPEIPIKPEPKPEPKAEVKL
jgi:hypothetical protein